MWNRARIVTVVADIGSKHDGEGEATAVGSSFVLLGYREVRYPAGDPINDLWRDATVVKGSGSDSRTLSPKGRTHTAFCAVAGRGARQVSPHTGDWTSSQFYGHIRFKVQDSGGTGATEGVASSTDERSIGVGHARLVTIAC